MTYNSSEKSIQISSKSYSQQMKSYLFEKSLCGTNDIKKERQCK